MASVNRLARHIIRAPYIQYEKITANRSVARTDNRPISRHEIVENLTTLTYWALTETAQ